MIKKRLISYLHKEETNNSIITLKENLKIALETSFYMLLKVEFLGHEIGKKTIKPIPFKVEAIKKIPSPEEKRDVMQLLGSVNFHSKIVEKLHVILNPYIIYYMMMSTSNGLLNLGKYFKCQKCNDSRYSIYNSKTKTSNFDSS